MTNEVRIILSDVILDGQLVTFEGMKAVIVFAHGSGSSRKSPRNLQVAKALNVAGFGTLLFDLLTDEESKNRESIFNIEFLSKRLFHVTQWLMQQRECRNKPIGYFGASTGAAAALQAAALFAPSQTIYSIVSRGGRPDLAGEALMKVNAPTLLLVGSLDSVVVELNQQAQHNLSNSKLSLIAGATHLFQEPGTLEEVSRQAIEWFTQSLSIAKMREHSHQTSDPAEAIERDIVELRKIKDLDTLIESIKDKRVVMLGEASHGTYEYYQIRRLISQRLIKDYGFRFIAVEGDWPDAYRLNSYIYKGIGESARSILRKNHRWPTWMWANEEIVRLAEWMRHNEAGFYGLDVYSLFESIDEILKYVKTYYPEISQDVEKRYACFAPFESDEIAYAKSLLRYPHGCEGEVLQNLRKMLELRLKPSIKDGEDLFSAQQNAHIIANAEAYYRAMLTGDDHSWNIRDGHMMETLDRLLERHGESSKAIVWAHNTHIGDYRATTMKASGYVNIGGLARQRYGEQNVALVGFGSYQGEVLAGAAWGAPEQVMPLPPAREESYEFYFHRVSLRRKLNQFYILLREKTETPLAKTRGHRAVGVVYDPHRERLGNYVPTELSQRYDAFIFIDRTQALKSLHTLPARGEFPETWPSGQ